MTDPDLTQAPPLSARRVPAAQLLGARPRLVAPALALSMAMLGAQGCGVEFDAAEDDLQPTQAALTALTWNGDGTEVASVRTAAGTLVAFVSAPDDELGIAILGTIGQADPALDQARRDAAGDPIKLYELLAGTPAPQALRAVVDRVARGYFRVDASDEGEAPIPSAPTLAPTAAAASGLCNITNWAHSGSGPFMYCWPDRYGTPWVKRKADHLSCRIDSVNGPQRARYRYKSGVNWHTSVDIWLSSGQAMEWISAYQWAQRWRECKTVDNPYSRRHHFRVVGHDWLAPLPFNPVSVSFPSP
jgi:hypothetical protein